MRLALALALAASPAAAWEFTASPVCTLSTRTDAGEVAVTYDPRAERAYAIRLALSEGDWGAGPVFSMRFTGARTISTDRHALSEGGAVLTVEDRGFGNVLAGIGAGGMASAETGTRAFSIPLEGAEAPLAAFRACAGAATV